MRQFFSTANTKVMSFVLLALLLVLGVAGPVAAQSVGGYVGLGAGIGVVSGGTSSNTNYASHIDGNSSSDIGGGSLATGSVYGTGASHQGTTNNASSWAASAGTLGQGYAGTQTAGGSTTTNYTVGITTGSGTGHSEGQAGADYSAVGHSSYSVDYTANQHDASGYVGVGVILGGAAGLSYAPYGSYAK